MGRIVTAGATVGCTHGGPATATQQSSRVTAGGVPIMTVTPAPAYSVACTLPSTPRCVTGNWVVGATKATSENMPIAVDAGTSLCQPTMARLEIRADQTRVEAK